MSQTTEEMRRNMEDILPQLLQYEARLRKKEQSTIRKIEVERSLVEKFINRRDFYEKLQSNMGPGQEEAQSKLDAAGRAVAVVQERVKEFEERKGELESKVKDVLTQNKLNVLPELERLGELLQSSKEEIAVSTRAYADDEQRLQEFVSLKDTVDSEDRKYQQTMKEREDTLSKLEARPDVHEEELATVQQEAHAIQLQIDCIEQSKSEVRVEISQQHHRKADIDQQQNTEIKKLHRDQKMLDERRMRVDGYKNELDQAKVVQHSLASERVEVEVHMKDAQKTIRNNGLFITAENRQINLEKRALVKRQHAVVKLKSSMPQMKSKLKDLQSTMSIINADKRTYMQMKSKVASKVDSSIMKLFDEEYVENDTLDSFQESAKLVAQGERETEQARADERRATKLLALTKEKRAFTLRKIQHAEHFKDDVNKNIHVHEMQKLDLSKCVKDAEKKAHNLSSLHDMLKEKTVEYTTLIGETKKALNEMKLRCERLKAELRERTVERTEKMKNLQEETDARIASQLMRSAERTDKSKTWTGYRRALEDVERQEAQIDKCNSSLRYSKWEVERATLQTEQLASIKQSMAEQLRVRKAQIVALYDTSLAISITAKKGELAIQRVEEERHAWERKNKDIQRSIDLVQREHGGTTIDEQIGDVKKKLEVQVLETERLSSELENPTNSSRFRTLDAVNDPSLEELKSKLSLLGKLMRQKKEALLSKEISAKEIMLHTQTLDETSRNWKIATQAILQDINEYQVRVQEKQRLRTAQMSEICMYDELIAASKTKISDLEKDNFLREQLAILETEVRSEERVANQENSPTPTPIKRRLGRPTAYLPLHDEENTIKVPRPYGALAPFKAGHIPNNLRHIKKPLKMELY